MRGMRVLDWPSVELRLWQEWDESDMAGVAARVRESGFSVGSVHLPPETERLLSTLECAEQASDLMDRCLEASQAAGAAVAVVHGWDLRVPGFSQRVMHESLRRFGERYREAGVSLSVEAIPGHVELLPEIRSCCPQVTFTLDTQWASFEDSWGLHPGLMPQVTNFHVQTHIDSSDDGSVLLGRTGAGPDFDAEAVVRSLAACHYCGLVTLEPRGVPGAGQLQLRLALRKLEIWLQDISGLSANMLRPTR